MSSGSRVYLGGTTILCLLVGLLSGLGAHAESAVKTLRILGRTPLPVAAHTVAKDIRWASADSVYVLHHFDGVYEVGLDGTVRRRMVDNYSKLHLSPYEHLAVSDQNLVAASLSLSLAWRPLKADADRSYLLESREFALTDAVDVQGDRILLFGMRDNPYRKNVETHGEVAWLGTLGSKLKDLKPVYFDRSGPRMPLYGHCRSLGIDAVRFMPDGSFVIVPGFEKGVYLYAAEGRLKHSWTSEQVGLDTDCSDISDDVEAELLTKQPVIDHWFRSHHVLDAILPLPQGPGLLVRSQGADGKVHWDLKVLSGSQVETYPVPLSGRRSTDRLRGDVRDGKIALLLSALGHGGRAAITDQQGEIVIMEAPH